ncbi:MULTISPECIES: DUF3618 domain-containing protein [unclassified Luteococcus]|uniref:DUF3618 domain-containing protein n=1 Tax=unclassified Luteococcus TaxID=2639923 RepID=UPI00313D0642
MADKKTDPRSAKQIQADIAAARARMSANVEGLVTEVHPKAVKQRSVDEAKAFVMNEVDYAKSTAKNAVKDDDGWRTDRISLGSGAAAVALVALLTVRAIVRKVTKKGKRK